MSQTIYVELMQELQLHISSEGPTRASSDQLYKGKGGSEFNSVI